MSLNPNLQETAIEQEVQYSKDHDFSNLGAVAVLVFDPSRTRVLLMGRRDQFYLAFPSGAETVSKHPNEPGKAASMELVHETGLEAELEQFQTYRDQRGGPKVGYYSLTIDEATFEEQFLIPKPPREANKEPKRPPGWYPVDLILSGKITLPFEQGIALRDFMKESALDS